MELIFVFSMRFLQIFFINFFELMKIVRTFLVYTFMYAKEFTVFLSHKGFPTMRADETKRFSHFFARAKGLGTNLALILAIATIVVVDELMRSATKRTHGIFRNGFAVTTLNWLCRFTIFPMIVFEKELPILFDKGFDDRKLVDFEFLVLRRMGIIESPLFERNISANKV